MLLADVYISVSTIMLLILAMHTAVRIHVYVPSANLSLSMRKIRDKRMGERKRSAAFAQLTV
jgi:hypothetical protein